MVTEEEMSKARKQMWAWIFILVLSLILLFNVDNEFVNFMSIVGVIMSFLGLFDILIQWRGHVRGKNKKEQEFKEVPELIPVNPSPVCISPEHILGYNTPIYTTTINIRNKLEVEQKIELFDKFYKFYIPPTVSIEVITQKEVVGKVEKEWKTSYHEFCLAMQSSALISKIKSSTDNRRLKFYFLSLFESKQPLEPQLTIDKRKRTEEDIWNPEEYNTADTEEMFILNGHTTIEVKLAPKEMFVLKIKNEAIQTSTFDEIKH